MGVIEGEFLYVSVGIAGNTSSWRGA